MAELDGVTVTDVEELEPEVVAAILRARARRHRRFALAVVIASIVGIGGMWYWMSLHLQSEDGRVIRQAPSAAAPVKPSSPPPAHLATADGAASMIRNHDRKAFESWIDGGGDPNVRTSHGDSLLRYAVWHGSDWAVRLLIDAGADLQPDDGKGDLFNMAVHRLIGGAGRTYYREQPQTVAYLLGPDTVVTPEHIRMIQRRRDHLLNEAETRTWRARDIGDLAIPKSLVDRADALQQLEDKLRYRVRDLPDEMLPNR